MYLDQKLRPIYNLTGSSGHCLLYQLADFQSFQETFFIKMDLFHGHFYKPIEEALKQLLNNIPKYIILFI